MRPSTKTRAGARRQKQSFTERPSYWLRPKLDRDGNNWFALYGKNIQDGVAGFGDTPDEAFADFDRNWFTHRGPSAYRGNAKG